MRKVTRHWFDALASIPILYPITSPTGDFNYPLTRMAKLTAAILRGSQTAILAAGDFSKINLGTWVDFPHPVLPLMIVTRLLSMASKIYFFRFAIGNSVASMF